METLTEDIVQLVSASCVFISVCDRYYFADKSSKL